MGSKFVQVTFRFHDMFSQPMEKAAAKMNRLNDRIQANHRKIQDYGKAVTREGQKISKMGSSLTKHVTAPIVGISTVSAKLATDFGKSMAQINTLLDDDSSLKGYEKAVLATSDKLGIEANTSAQGMYQTISVLGDHGKTTQKTFDIMARASKAGGAEVVDAVNMIATAMNGYGKTSDETAQLISDLSFKTVKLGKTTFPELANSMSSLFPLGKSLNISYEELYATMSTATTSFAGNTAEASTQIKGLMTGFLKPSKDMQALLDKTGYSSGAALIKAKGLAGALELVQKHAGKDGMSKYFKNVRGLTAALGMSGSGMDKYKKHLKEMKNATGATGEALRKMGDTDAAKFNKAMVRLQNAGIKFGAAVLPVITPMITKLGNAISKAGKWFSSLSKEQQNMIVKSLMVAAAIGPVLKIVGGITTKVGGAISFVGKFGKAMEDAGSFAGALVKTFPIAGRAILGVGKVFATVGKVFLGALVKTLPIAGRAILGVGKAFATVGKLFLTNPIGIAITLLAIGAVLVIKNWDKVKPHLKPVFDLLKKGAEIFKQFASAAKKQFKKAVSGVKDFAEGVKKKMEAVKGFFKRAPEAAGALKEGLKNKFKSAVGAVAGFVNDCKGSTSGIKGYFGGIINFVSGVFTGNWKQAWNGVVQTFKAYFGMLKNVAKTCLGPMYILVTKGAVVFKSFATAAKKQFLKAVEGVKSFTDGAKKRMGTIKGVLKKGVEAVKWFANREKQGFMICISAVAAFKNNLAEKFGAAVATVKKFGQRVKTGMATVKSVLSGVVSWVAGTFKSGWSKAWSGVVSAFKTIFSGIKSAVKAPLNSVISLVNSAISKLNAFHVDVPKALGGGSIGFNISSIPHLARGTMDWKGGPAMVHDKGAEIINLPKHSQVIPHEISMEMARSGGSNNTININKLADKLVVRNDQDIDKIADALVSRLEMLQGDMVYG